jgi:hypothetical protein
MNDTPTFNGPYTPRALNSWWEDLGRPSYIRISEVGWTQIEVNTAANGTDIYDDKWRGIAVIITYD